MRLVCGQGQHDEVSIQPVHHVLGVGVPALLAALLPHKRHRLVLALTRHVGVRQDHLEADDRQAGAMRAAQCGQGVTWQALPSLVRRWVG